MCFVITAIVIAQNLQRRPDASNSLLHFWLALREGGFLFCSKLVHLILCGSEVCQSLLQGSCFFLELRCASRHAINLRGQFVDLSIFVRLLDFRLTDLFITPC